MFNVTDAGVIGAVQVVLTIVGIAIKDLVRDKKAQAKAIAAVDTIKEKAPEAVELGEKALAGVENVVKKVIHSPEVAARIAPLEHKVNAESAKFQESKLLGLCSAALHAYRRGVDDLTVDEKATTVQFVQTELAKIGVKVTEGEVLTGLTIADTTAKDFINSALFQQTAQLVATKAKMQAITTESTAPTPTPATAQ